MNNKKERIVIEKKKKTKEAKDSDKPSKFKTFFYGIGKEFERTSWTTKRKVFSDFFVVVIIVVLLAAIFTGIALVMIKFL